MENGLDPCLGGVGVMKNLFKHKHMYANLTVMSIHEKSS